MIYLIFNNITYTLNPNVGIRHYQALWCSEVTKMKPGLQYKVEK